tara:strand:+ start:553 stop:1968 length:1416 start_codon:yes stop_codon:yes gene_type:complete
MATNPEALHHGRNVSRHHGNASRHLPTFYMYETAALDHSWMRHCSQFEPWTTGVRNQNTAEVGAHAVLSSQTSALRVRNPEHADLFFVPIFPYLSQKVGHCEGRHGNQTHTGRMQLAADALARSKWWQRRRGRDHFYVVSTWSTSRMSFYAQMHELGRKLSCGVCGRYKPFPLVAPRLYSALASCPFHAPYAPNPYAHLEYEKQAPRKLLLSFAGSFDVCCTGKAIRCKMGDLMVAALGQQDVMIRPSLPGNGSQVVLESLGKCTKRAMQLVADARAKQKTRRRLSVAGLNAREAVITASAVVTDAQVLATSVFCLNPAGDTCVAGRFYSSLAAGCIPVVICPGVGQHPVPFDRSKVVDFEPFWVDFSWATFNKRPAALLEHLRGMSPEKVAAYQRAVEKHRRDLVYEVPGSRVGSNMLGEIKHACFSDRTKARMAQKQTCGANASWPYPIKNASAAVETPADEPAGAEEP